VTTDQDYLKLKTGPGAGRIYCEEHVGWGECQKAWSASCGCDVCADQEEQNECEICGATSDINDDWHGNSVCDECFMCCEECSNTKNPAVFEKTASDLCECEEKKDIVGCCEKCDMEIVRDSDDHDNCLIIDGGDSADKFCCQSCEWEDEQTCDGCGTTCLDHTSNKGRGSESPCEECEETRCKLCPCACEENQLLEEFWDGGMKEMWGEELREGHPLWEPFKLYKAMKKEQDA
jgi:hypothetical protein